MSRRPFTSRVPRNTSARPPGVYCPSTMSSSGSLTAGCKALALTRSVSTVRANEAFIFRILASSNVVRIVQRVECNCWELGTRFDTEGGSLLAPCGSAREWSLISYCSSCEKAETLCLAKLHFGSTDGHSTALEANGVEFISPVRVVYAWLGQANDASSG